MAKRLLLLSMMLAAPIVSPGEPAPRTADAPWALSVRPIESPAAADSGQPQLSVSARGVLISWIERQGAAATLKFAERTVEGWSPALTVASGTNWFVNWSDVPSVTRLPDGTLAAHWLQKSGAGTYAYDVRLSYSTDGGRTWAPSFTPHHDGTQTEHGFASAFPLPGPNGVFGIAWLDGRAMAGGSTKRANHGTHGPGSMSVRYAAYDRRWKQIADEPIDFRVCECCPTTAAVTADGPIVAFRNRSADNVRDIHVSRLERGTWTESVAVHEDEWRIGACPVNGPMLSARGRDVAVAWFTAPADRPQAYVAFSRDAGRTFATPIRLDDESTLGRVDVELLPDGSAAASYIEFAGGRARFNVRRVAPSGARSAAITIAGIEEGRTSGYPRLALHRDELVFAWLERAETPRVRTAVATLPR